jgi:hypothetical protein
VHFSLISSGKRIKPIESENMPDDPWIYCNSGFGKVIDDVYYCLPGPENVLNVSLSYDLGTDCERREFNDPNDLDNFVVT